MATEKEIIEQIAKTSAPRIIEEADAQDMTTVEEVATIIVTLLSDPASRKAIEEDVRFKADESLYMLSDRKHGILYRSPKLTDVKLSQLERWGVDYGGLSCWVLDGEIFGDLTKAIRTGIVDSWGGILAGDIIDEQEV